MVTIKNKSEEVLISFIDVNIEAYFVIHKFELTK